MIRGVKVCVDRIYSHIIFPRTKYMSILKNGAMQTRVSVIEEASLPSYCGHGVLSSWYFYPQSFAKFPAKPLTLD